MFSSKMTPETLTRGRSWVSSRGNTIFKSSSKDFVHHTLCSSCCTAWQSWLKLWVRDQSFGDRLCSPKILTGHHHRDLKILDQKASESVSVYLLALQTRKQHGISSNSGVLVAVTDSSKTRLQQTCVTVIPPEHRPDSAPSTRIGSCRAALTAGSCQNWWNLPS